MANGTLIWFHQRNLELAKARAAREPDARLLNVKGWVGRVEVPAARVIVDRAAANVAAAYEADGAVVEWLQEAPKAVPQAAAPPPEARVIMPDQGGVGSAALDTLPDGTYTVSANGSWFTLYDPDGNKVGSSQRTEAEAWAQLDDMEG